MPRGAQTAQTVPGPEEVVPYPVERVVEADSSSLAGPEIDQAIQSDLFTLRAIGETSVDRSPSVDDFDALEIRQLNRIVTRQELLPQRRQIAKKRMVLFTKNLSEPLTRREAAALRYLEWQLDRIEDATVGEELDRLSAIADAQETLAKRVSGWLKEIRRAVPRSKHSGRKQQARSYSR